MIHLIDRIYIEYAETKPLRTDPTLKPESYIRIIDRGVSGLYDIDTADKNLLNFKLYEDAVQQFDGTHNFINFLLSKTNTDESKKIIIYADEVGTLQLLMSLWKGLFPNLTAQGAWKIYMTYRDFEKFKPKDFADYIAFDRDSHRLEKKDFFEIYWGYAYEKFEGLFGITPAMELSAEQKESIGLEFLIIKYLLNKEGEHKALKSKVDHFYKKTLAYEIFELKEFCREYLYNILLTERILTDDIALSNKAISDLISKNEKYKAIIDPEINSSVNSYTYIRNTYNLFKLIHDLTRAESLVSDSMGVQQEKKDIALCSYILDNRQEPEATEILDDELHYVSKYKIFRQLAKKGRYNQYLVLAFLNTFEKDKESLAEFME